MRRMIPLAAALGLAAACTTGIQLTDKGERTRELSMTELPSGCRLIGDVTIGLPPDAGRPRTREDLNKLMRNRAGQNGGNVVVVDFAEERNPNDEDARHWVGRGRAYACPEEQSAGAEAPLEEDDDLGGDSGDLDGEDLGLDEEGQQAEEDDASGVSDEDLLDL